MYETINNAVVLKAKHKLDHDELTVLYYQKHAISKTDFEAQHAQIHRDYQTRLYQLVGKPLRPIDEEKLVEKLIAKNIIKNRSEVEK